MRKLIKYTIVGVVVLLMFGSCDKNRFLTAVQVPTAPWTNLASFEMAAIAPYEYLHLGGWNDALGVSWWADMASSDIGVVAPTVPPAGIGWNLWAYRQFQSTTVTGPQAAGGGREYSIFMSMYQMITACNDALNFISSAGTGNIFPGVTVQNADIQRIQAECLFNRARAYFYLVNQFCPPYNPGGDNSLKLLPLKNEFTNDPAKLRNTKLASSQEIYDLIISDLKTAKTLMPKSYSQEGRANYYALCGELARVYFLRGSATDHAFAKAECDEILNSGKFPLQSDVMATWNKAPGDTPASEVIMEFAPNSTSGDGEWDATICTKTMPWGIKNGGRGVDWQQCGWCMFYYSNYWMKETGYVVDPPNDYTVGPVALLDKRYNNTCIRLEGYIPQPSGMDFVTYQNTIQTTFQGLTWPQIWQDKLYRGANCALTKQPLYRSAEFYLTRAAIDCESKSGDFGEADLNTVRNRAGLLSIHKGNFASTDAWFTEIHRERMREMTIENGDRCRYVMSLRLPLGLGDRPADGSKGAIVNPPYSSWYWKIPLDEVNGNSAYPPGFNN